MSSAPDRFGRFALLDLLGEGGMGRVYRARIEGPGGFRKDLALKVLRAEPDRDPERLASALAKEARIGALLRHPNLVDLYDYGVLDGQPWFSMELVPGHSLDRILDDGGPMEPSRAAALLAQIALGLAAIHELDIEGEPAGLVHRDLKPANVLVTPDDHVKLADFGISRGQHAITATATESLRGTPAYMSPEQARSLELDGRSDLFALGLIGWELITGQRFLRGGSVFEVMFSLLQVEQKQDEVRALDSRAPGLGTLLASLLREDPAQRPSSARAVRDQLLALDLRARPAAKPEWATSTLSSTATTLLAPSSGGNLQAAPDSFVGRDRELVALREALQTPGQVVSLLGPGGTGKTRLARELGLGVQDEYPGGAWFVDLTEARTQEGICAAVAHALDIPLERGGGDPTDRIGAVLTQRGRLLLLLDNFEQVQGFAAATVGAWARLAPGCRFVVTTRQRLALGAEQVVRVGPLRSPISGAASPDQLAEVPAVRLFVDRAQRSRPDFTLNDENASVIATLVRALDGIPLAIELAAARVRVLSVARLLERLPQRFNLLSTGRTDVTGRQATLRATIDWSWTLLHPWEQAGLAQASVFRGGFTVEAAEAVLDLSAWPDAPWVMDVVQALEDKSLLRSVAAPSGEMRFVHYESIREFAAEKLREQADPKMLAGRHLDWFSKRGTAAAIDSLSTKGGIARRRRLKEDLENLWHAAELAVELGRPDAAADATLAAADVLAFVGPLGIPLRMLTTVLAVDGLSEHQRIRLLLARGQVHNLLSDVDLAKQDLREAERRAHAAGESHLEAIAWAELGRVVLGSADGEQEDLLERARQAFIAAGDARREGWVLCFQAVKDSIAGRFEDSRAKNEQALRKLRRAGDRMTSLVALGNLAISYKEVGMSMLQLATLNEALRLARELEARRYEAVVLTNLGVYHHYVGQLRRAEELYEEARALARSIGFKSVEGNATGNLGDVLKDQGRFAEAESWLRVSLEFTEASGELNHHTGQLVELAQILLALGKLDEAEEAIAEAAALAPKVGNPRHIGQADVCLGELHRQRGEYDTAEAVLERAEATLADLHESRFLVEARTARAELALTRGDAPRAQQIAASTDDQARDVGDPVVHAGVLSVRARAERALDLPTWPATAAELADVLDGVELGPQAPLRQVLDALRS